MIENQIDFNEIKQADKMYFLQNIQDFSRFQLQRQYV